MRLGRQAVLLHQDVIEFLHVALECSIYVNPTDPGLTAAELTEAARRAGFFEGEINDALPRAVSLPFGPQTQKINLDKRHALALTMFNAHEQPDYRNRQAFHALFEVMRRTVREKGLANARLARSLLVEKVTDKGFSELDAQIAIAVLLLNEILVEEQGTVRFQSGKEGYGSPGDPGNLRVRQIGIPVIRTVREKAYPIVKGLISERNLPVIASTHLEQGPSNDQWLKANMALDLLGQGYTRGVRAICKRAHAGLIKARAKRFMADSRVDDNVDIPSQFWWAEGEAALKQDWTTGDFDTWIKDEIHLRAFGVEFRRSDIEDMVTQTKKEPSVKPKTVFIGHGHSAIWKELRDFLRDRLKLSVDEFNMGSAAGMTTIERLSEMLDAAGFAFLVLTAEDEMKDGTIRARDNVIHETGLFQGRLGFKKAILLLEDSCNEFSNIVGLGQVRFSRDNLAASYEEIRKVLERENII